MTDFIQDGTGAGYRAKVDAKNRVHALAVSESGGTEAATNGDLYNINTGSINLATANPSGLLYMKNTDTVSWIYNRVFYNAGVSVGGSGEFIAEIFANATEGTLIDSGTDLEPANLNFGSSKILTGTTLKGAEGLTVTNGDVRVSTIIPASGTRVLIAFDSIILEPGSSIAVRVTPQAGNTDMDIQVGFNLYRKVA